MARVYQINENGRSGLNLSGSGASPKYSGDNITNNKMDESSIMDIRQETEYVILVGKCEREHLGDLDVDRKTILEWICNK